MRDMVKNVLIFHLLLCNRLYFIAITMHAHHYLKDRLIYLYDNCTGRRVANPGLDGTSELPKLVLRLISPLPHIYN